MEPWGIRYFTWDSTSGSLYTNLGKDIQQGAI